jgi:hypothetical protein
VARPRSIEISGLNIAMHAPHSMARYVDLFNDALRLRLPLRVSNVHMLMLGSVFPDNPDRPEDGLNGSIYRFVRLDPNEPWFNAETHEVATPDDLRQINIPSNLLPHLQTFPFVFRPSTHHLFYVRKDRKDSMGASYVKSLLDHLFKALVLAGRHPEVSVTVIPDEQSIERIFGMRSMEKLIIELNRPNPDDGDDEQTRWEEKLRNQNLKKMSLTLQSARGESIVADNETRSMAQAASLNGKVIAVGLDQEGKKVEESTVARNLVEYVPIDTVMDTVQGALSRTALSIDSRLG